MTIRSLTLETVDGCRLAADLAVPGGEPVVAPTVCAVMCHPHPLYGGDRYNSVVDAVFEALPRAGIACLRFDFRGVGASTGSHGGGTTEVHDLVAALDALTGALPRRSADAPGLTVIAAGYSFGAGVALRCLDERIDAWVAVAPPLRMVDTLAGPDPRPKLLLVPAHDQYTDPAAVVAGTGAWASTTIEEVPNADHFLGGRAAWVVHRVAGWALAASQPAAAGDGS